MAQIVPRIKITGAGVVAANGIFAAQSPNVIPVGFAKVCNDNAWNVRQTWSQLTDLSTPWYLKQDGAYVYYNKGDGKWWIDAPQGHGLYIANADLKNKEMPPSKGWQMLDNKYGPIPNVIMVKEDQ